MTAAGPPILDVEALVALVHDVEQASGHGVQDLFFYTRLFSSRHSVLVGKSIRPRHWPWAQSRLNHNTRFALLCPALARRRKGSQHSTPASQVWLNHPINTKVYNKQAPKHTLTLPGTSLQGRESLHDAGLRASLVLHSLYWQQAVTKYRKNHDTVMHRYRI